MLLAHLCKTCHPQFEFRCLDLVGVRKYLHNIGTYYILFKIYLRNAMGYIVALYYLRQKGTADLQSE